MPKLVLLIASLLALYIAVTRIKQMPVAKRRSAYIQLAFIVAAGVAILLAATGKMHWIGALLTGLLVLIRQTLPLLVQFAPHLWGRLSRSAAGQSQVDTSLLRMTLDHDSGKLDGEVLAGTFQRQILSQLDQAQLDELLDYCKANDADSAQLLRTYLEQRFGAAYQSQESYQPSSSGTELTEQEALATLGLKSGATKEEVIAAHRRLMQKLHPDRGGNDYLAARVNAAKDFLLGE